MFKVRLYRKIIWQGYITSPDNSLIIPAMSVIFINGYLHLLAKDLDGFELGRCRSCDSKLATDYHHAETLMVFLQQFLMHSLACRVVL